MCASNAGIHSGTYLVHFQAPHLRSIEFGVFSSLSLSSVHLQLWLHLHLGNRTSTLRGCSGLHGAEVGVGVEQAAPLCTPPPGEGRGRESGSSAPHAFGVELWPAAAERRGAAAAPRSPGAPAGPHKVCSQQPCAAELPERCSGPARRVRRDPLGRQHADRRGACRENFEKLRRRNLRLHLASRGTSGGAGLARGNAARSQQPLTRNFPARLGGGLCFAWFSQARLTVVADRLAGEPGEPRG